MIKKQFKSGLFGLALSVTVASAIIPSSAAFASANNTVDTKVFSTTATVTTSYTNDEIDSILLQHGMPFEQITSLDPELKRTLVEHASDKNFKFAGASSSIYHRDDTTGALVANSTINEGGMQTMAISRADLVFNAITFTTSVANEYQVYGNFEWLTTGVGPSGAPNSIYKDMFAITVPTGWTIESGKYGANMYKNLFNIVTGFGGWIDAGTTGFENSGQPASDGYSLYGAAWRMNSATDTSNVFYKGTTWLTMKGTASSQKRTILSYMQAKNSGTGGFGVTLGWGPLSISYTATSGSTDTANADYSW
ncbi:hypothetical protein A8990_1842 [Paenibacillus taihuensis]|uniref:Uncharacterized protein n=1 Tax=Paenibacillus taihuensis TaxID=1156355 RepID=A0A3D9Q0Z3_9BACL|nr:hypothetical protein [Paenibacillus taihuensis]REE54708.1 hypothetical protein A8990_1842 [Paenibacillus taihuensis]